MKPIFIHPVLPVNKASRSSMGAKAAGLANAAYYGAHIPKSYYLIRDDIETYLQKLPNYEDAKTNWSEYSQHNTKSGDIETFKEAILNATLPDTWTTAIARLFLEWNCSELYIRSNFSCEDQNHCALAGCFTSIICNNDGRAMQRAVLEVLASGFEPASIAVLMANGITFDRIRPNILIQPVMRGSCGGVAFSRHPDQPWIRPRKGHAWGLVEWTTNGSQGVCEGDAAVGQAMFSDTLGKTNAERRMFRTLAKLVHHLETKLATPVDVEWLWRDNKIILLQVRPMADAAAQLAVRTRTNQTWSRHLTQERFPTAISPLGWSALQPSLKTSVQGLRDYLGLRVTDPSLVASSLHGYVYANDKCFAFPQFTRLDLEFWWSRSTVARWIAGLWLVLSAKKKNKRTLFLFQTCLTLLHKPFRKLATAYRAKRKQLDKDLLPLEQVAQAFRLYNSTPTPAQLIELFQTSIKIGQEFMHTDFAVFILKEVHAAVLKPHLGTINLERAKSTRVLASTDNPTLHMQDQFTKLAAQLIAWEGWPAASKDLLSQKHIHSGSIHSFQNAPVALATAWQNFWNQHGSLRFSWDIRDGNWLSDAKTFVNLVRTFESHARTSESLSPTTMTDDKPDSALLVSPLEDALQERFTELLWFDEDQHHSACRILSNAHDLVEIAAEILYGQKLLVDRGDIYFLHVSELLDALGGKLNGIGFIAARRKSIWTHQTPKFEAVKTLGYNVDDLKNILKNAGNQDAQGASGGFASGPAIVAENFAELAVFAPGSILVTSSPKPEFAAIYPLLGGIVTKTGGMLAHGFVAARELGVPAISGYREFDAIKTGMILTIDGTLGTVTVGTSP